MFFVLDNSCLCDSYANRSLNFILPCFLHTFPFLYAFYCFIIIFFLSKCCVAQQLKIFFLQKNLSDSIWSLLSLINGRSLLFTLIQLEFIHHHLPTKRPALTLVCFVRIYFHIFCDLFFGLNLQNIFIAIICKLLH